VPDVALGSLHMQQLHGFDKLRDDQGVIRNRSAKIDTTAVSIHLSALSFSFRFLPLAKIIERMENGTIFGRSDEGQDDLWGNDPCIIIQIWTSGTCIKSSHVNRMSGSRDNVLRPR
jgi:hypothetical protein